MIAAACKIHPDCHMPPEIEVGRGFDADAYAARLRESGAGTAVVFGKCHYGFAYYPTRVGTPHPRLASDVVGESVRALRRHGLRSVVYLSVFLDSAAAEAHPDWRLITPDAPALAAGSEGVGFRALCVNSPYADELLIPMCAEIIREYAPDELFFDTMSLFRACGCARCAAAFGGPIPAPADPAWGGYVRWYARCFGDFFSRVTDQLRSLAPVTVTWNWKWCWNEAALPSRREGMRLAADSVALPHRVSLHCRWFAGTGMPFDYMCGRFAHGMTEWNNNSRASLLTTAALAAAHGGGFWLLDRCLPDCGLEERGWSALRMVATELERRRPWAAEGGHVAETAVLCSADHLLGRDLRWFPDVHTREKRGRPIEGVARLLGTRGRHGTLLGRERLLERLDDYRLAILPDVEELDDELLSRLGAWVENGGALLASAPAAGIGAGLAALAGVAVEGWREGAYGFIATGPDPLCVQARFARLIPLAGTQTLQAHHAPVIERYGHGMGPPGAADGAAVTWRAYGRGVVALLGFPAFTNAWEWPLPETEQLLVDIIDRLLPEPVVRVDHPAAIEVVARRRGDDLIVHLVNRSGVVELAAWWLPQCRYLPQLRDVVMHVRRPEWVEVEAIRRPSGEQLPIVAEGPSLVLTIAELDHSWDIIEMPGYFAMTMRTNYRPGLRGSSGRSCRRRAVERDGFAEGFL